MKKLTAKEKAIVRRAADTLAVGYLTHSCTALEEAGASAKLVRQYQSFYDCGAGAWGWNIIQGQGFPYLFSPDTQRFCRGVRVLLLLLFAETGGVL